ncbi:hypothetical protein RHGRI_012008 [Rhododendron griersonianum]|nr:hypothetical protein RHGRI_012008 [Rhododendron griersonianum]
MEMEMEMVRKKKREGCSRGSESELMEEEEIPEEIIVEEIMWRLPVKPLARFRSVCKTLNSTIASDPKFSILQLKNSSAIRTPFDRQRVLLWDCRDCSSAFFLEKKNHQLLTTNNSSSEFAIEKINTCPIKVNNKGCSSPTYSIVASCDGLVCILHRMTKSILFWNPLTGETKRVADPPTRIFRFSNCRTYGLGYDSSADDYKLVWINLGFENIETGVPEPNEVGIFSLRTNSWRRIQDFPTTKLCSLEPGVFINGALYWTGFSKDSPDHSYKVVSFCLEKEKYTLLDIPAIDFPLRVFHIGIQVLGDKLAVYYPSNVDGSYHLFFLNLCDHGESWTKHTVTLPNRKWFDPLCLLENVEEVLFQGRGGELGVYRLTDGIFSA